MKTTHYLLGAGFAALLTLSCCSGKREATGVSGRDTASGAHPANAERAGGAAAIDSNARPRPTPGSPARARNGEEQEALYRAYRCRTDQCASEPLGASTAAEASWLQSRGFPTPDHEADLENMSLGQLQLSADSGDLAAKAILGRRLMEKGDMDEGISQLIDAASHGSVYADYQRSQALRSSNIYESAAFLRRAYLQGDAKAAAIMYRRFPSFLTPEWANVDEQAMRFYQALLVQRANKGGMPFGPRPRP